MTERQKLIAEKQHIMAVKAALKRLCGVEVIQIFENNENPELNDMYSVYQPIMCSYMGKPYSKISYRSSKEEIILWIVSNMNLKEGNIYFFYCLGTWVKIKLSDLFEGVWSLFDYSGGSCGFLLSDVSMSHMMEVSFDSRDEENYCIDIWKYKNKWFYAI